MFRLPCNLEYLIDKLERGFTSTIIDAESPYELTHNLGFKPSLWLRDFDQPNGIYTDYPDDNKIILTWDTETKLSCKATCF